MHILVLNSGSSSLKFRLFAAAVAVQDAATFHTVVSGAIEEIGGAAALHLRAEGMPVSRHERPIPDHGQALHWLFEHLQSQRTVSGGDVLPARVDAVGHRVVHGGARFQQASRIDTEVLAAIDAMSALAPLHNPACLAGIRGAQEAFGQDVPMVAVFDTAFHHTLPPAAATYAIPHQLAARHQLRRYGFHGIAHASLAAGYASATGQDAADLRLITLHLGNGCSATAIRHGQSVETSMGFTPLEGLVMGTRSGDLDPAVVSFLARRESMTLEEVEGLLNKRSGLLGVSGLSHDMRQLLSAAQRQEARAALAIELFCHRARKYLGAYLAVLGGADAVVFGGGIGEHAPSIRSRICADRDWCGLQLDPGRNDAAVELAAGSAARISTDTARIDVQVVAADEETWIARETLRCLQR